MECYTKFQPGAIFILVSTLNWQAVCSPTKAYYNHRTGGRDCKDENASDISSLAIYFTQFTCKHVIFRNYAEKSPYRIAMQSLVCRSSFLLTATQRESRSRRLTGLTSPPYIEKKLKVSKKLKISLRQRLPCSSHVSAQNRHITITCNSLFTHILFLSLPLICHTVELCFVFHSSTA